MRTISLIVLATLAALAACDEVNTAAIEQPHLVGANAPHATLPAGNTNNYQLFDSHRYTFIGDASGSTITGLDPSGLDQNGEIFIVRNVGGPPITFAHQSTASTAGYRIESPTGADFTLRGGDAVWLDWDIEDGVWRPVVAPSFGPVTVATPSRALGTAFCPSSSRAVMGVYSVRITSALTLTSGQSGRVELLSDTANPPTTVRARIAGGNTGTLTIGLNTSDVTEGALSYLIPPGHCVLLQSVNETGTPTYSITAQTETTL